MSSTIARRSWDRWVKLSRENFDIEPIDMFAPTLIPPSAASAMRSPGTKAMPASRAFRGVSSRIRMRELTPRKAREAGIAFVPGDRMAEAALGGMSVGANMSIGSMSKFSRLSFTQRSHERRAMVELIHRFGIVPQDQDMD